ncbi:hypothetical protein I541_4815 [Mycobacteroides abscessus]|nr:hypothetical protein I541_4815 [Mycobacteroides abscessus]
MDSDVTDIRWMWKGRDSFSNPKRSWVWSTAVHSPVHNRQLWWM